MKHSKLLLPILLVANLLCMMDVSIMTIVIPEIQTAFNESLTNLSWTVNIYTIVFATLIIPFGRLAERFGRNRFVFIGLIIFGLASLMTGLSENLTIMLIARAFQSVGAAMIIPTSMVIALEESDTSSRNKVIGALAGAQGLAVALGPTIGGVVSQYWNWRWVFFINVPLLILLGIVYPFVLHINQESRRFVKIDWVGAILSAISLFTLSLTLIKGNDWNWLSTNTLSLLLVSLVSFILFIIQEKKSSSPMINLSLFKSNNFKGASLALLLCNYFMGGMVILIPTLLTKVQGESELNAGLLITPYSISVMFTVILTSMLVKKINNKILIGTGFITIAVSYYLLSHLDIQKNYNYLMIAGVLLGLGYGLVAATANILVAADFKGTKLADSQSVANVLRQVGLVLAIALFTSLLSGNLKTAKRTTYSYAQQMVKKADLNDTVKNKINTKLDKKLNNNDSSNTDINRKIKIEYNKKDVERKAISEAYTQQLQIIAEKSGMSTDQIPQSVKQKIKVNVNNILLPKIKVQENKTIKTVNNIISDVKDRFKSEARKAFMNVYSVMNIIPLLALFLLPLFNLKKKNVE